MAVQRNALIAYDTSTGTVVEVCTFTRGFPPVDNLQNYNAATHSLTGSMEVYDADDYIRDYDEYLKLISGDIAGEGND